MVFQLVLDQTDPALGPIHFENTPKLRTRLLHVRFGVVARRGDPKPTIHPSAATKSASFLPHGAQAPTSSVQYFHRLVSEAAMAMSQH